MLVGPLLCMVFLVLFALSYLFSFFFPFVTEKDEKTFFNTEINDFDERTVCGAPVCWSKYTKDDNSSTEGQLKTIRDEMYEIQDHKKNRSTTTSQKDKC